MTQAKASGPQRRVQCALALHHHATRSESSEVGWPPSKLVQCKKHCTLLLAACCLLLAEICPELLAHGNIGFHLARHVEPQRLTVENQQRRAAHDIGCNASPHCTITRVGRNQARSVGHRRRWCNAQKASHPTSFAGLVVVHTRVRRLGRYSGCSSTAHCRSPTPAVA